MKIRISAEYEVSDGLVKELTEEKGRPPTAEELIEVERTCFKSSPKDYLYFFTDDPEEVLFEDADPVIPQDPTEMYHAFTDLNEIDPDAAETLRISQHEEMFAATLEGITVAEAAAIALTAIQRRFPDLVESQLDNITGALTVMLIEQIRHTRMPEAEIESP